MKLWKIIQPRYRRAMWILIAVAGLWLVLRILLRHA